MIPTFNPMTCRNLAVPAVVMQRVVQVESGANPFAIGVVGGRLERQPRNLGEAVATAHMLESKGYDYSLGIAQVNRNNLVRYGLDTFPKAFDGCANLAVGSRILAECYVRSGGDWGKALSCYYTGNFTAGYRDGYVQRVYAAIDAGVPENSKPVVYSQARKRPSGTLIAAPRSATPDTPTYRVSIPSVALDPDVDPLASDATHAAASPTGSKVALASKSIARAEIPDTPDHRVRPVFEPRVSRPEDRVVAKAAVAQSVPSGSSAIFVPASQTSTAAQEMGDAAFVF
ncbi:lytic transglycosylase domain-containing protein [Frateuria terrea]|uniref:Type IV secretion system protein VirB1 n=1 Tax=Frateuria terrea TaxID=529704 RepID=A0A1H6TUC2_9GAMM|nr:lytic transglycosylase domain-containing protein [Frateuria terrea]SEI83663.1 type IV secretion system protein VirB1 [Frateuria terrea]SFP40192.1 type IV secretion system protein VirB1 [Frateuria terrea]